MPRHGDTDKCATRKTRPNRLARDEDNKMKKNRYRNKKDDYIKTTKMPGR